MLFQGILDVFTFPPKDSIEVTPEQEEQFVKCVLANTPYTETVKLGNFTIVFTTPSAEEFPVLHNTEENLFADYLFASNIKSIRRDENIIYVKDDRTSLEEKLDKIKKLFQDSVMLPVLFGYWYKFRVTYNKLFEKVVSSDFLRKTKNTSDG